MTDDIDRLVRVRVVADGLPPTPSRNPWHIRATAGLALSVAYGADASIEIPGTVDPILATSGRLFDLDASLGITTSGGKVSAWQDQSGVSDANRLLVQATSANRPLYNASDAGYGGKPTVQGVAADETSMSPTGSWSVSIAQPYTLYVVGEVGSSGYLVATTSPSFDDGHRITLFDYGIGSLSLDNYPNTNYLIPGGTPGVPGVYCYVVDGAGVSAAYANSLSSAGVSATFTDSFGWKDLMLFANPTGNNADGKLARFIVFLGAHDDATRIAITNALGTMYGGTITP